MTNYKKQVQGFASVIILVMVVAVGIIFFLGKQKNNLGSIIKLSTPTATQVPNSTSNWKTYTNTKYNYSIRLPSAYPDNSEANIDQSSGELDLKMVTRSVWVAVWKNSGNLTTDEWLKENGNMIGKNTYPAQKTTFNGYDALVSNRGQSTNWYFVSHGNYIYEIEDNQAIGDAPTFKPTQQQIQDQKEILSTFKFISPVTTNTSSSTSAVAPNDVIYEAHFYPNNANKAKSDYEGFDYIKFDEQKKVAIFNNGNIYFEYEPNKYNLSYQILNNPPEGPKEKQTQLINLEDINSKYKLVMNLHRYGIGGGPCPDFPKGFEMSSVMLDNKNIFKAKFIDEKTASLNWPLGKIYLVDKGQYGWNCPSIRGLSSVKNGSVDIQYDLSLFGQNYNSQDYIAAEKNLDKVVSTIRNFWQ